MAQLEARSRLDDSRNWTRPLPLAEIRIGRMQTNCDWVVDWDSKLSGLSGFHAAILWHNGKLRVRRRMLPRPTTNPIFYRGVQMDEIELGPGEQFVIGDTIFTVIDNPAPASPHSVAELTISRDQLHQFRYVDPQQRLEALAELPALIREAPTDGALEEKVVNVLLRGVPRAEVAAVVQLVPCEQGEVKAFVRCSARQRGHRDNGAQPNLRLLRKAIETTREPVLHVFGSRGSDLSSYTNADPETEWAMFAPMRDEASMGWALYLAGRLPRDLSTAENLSQEVELKGDLKFAELVADLFGSLRQMRDLQTRVSSMGRYFSRHVLTVIGQQDLNELLEARPTLVTVLFCDLRGSCRIAEEGQDDLHKLWETVSEALGIMTSAILENDGVVGDFQGDAAMGFWGWPGTQGDSSVSGSGLSPNLHELQRASAEQIERAARAALTIRRKFGHLAKEKGHGLGGFACGIGLAHGIAMAGRIGTLDQFKVGVFGPVVNTAARLESLTKQFRVSILADDSIAAALKQRGWVRTRPVAKVIPAGMSAPIGIAELLLPAAEGLDLSEARRLDYDVAIKAFEAGKWSDALRKLAFTDGPSDFIKAFIQEHPAGPPAGWTGVIPLKSK